MGGAKALEKLPSRVFDCDHRLRYAARGWASAYGTGARETALAASREFGDDTLAALDFHQKHTRR